MIPAIPAHRYHHNWPSLFDCLQVISNCLAGGAFCGRSLSRGEYEVIGRNEGGGLLWLDESKNTAVNRPSWSPHEGPWPQLACSCCLLHTPSHSRSLSFCFAFDLFTRMFITPWDAFEIISKNKDATHWGRPLPVPLPLPGIVDRIGTERNGLAWPGLDCCAVCWGKFDKFSEKRKGK